MSSDNEAETFETAAKVQTDPPKMAEDVSNTAPVPPIPSAEVNLSKPADPIDNSLRDRNAIDVKVSDPVENDRCEDNANENSEPLNSSKSDLDPDVDESVKENNVDHAEDRADSVNVSENVNSESDDKSNNLPISECDLVQNDISDSDIKKEVSVPDSIKTTDKDISMEVEEKGEEDIQQNGPDVDLEDAACDNDEKMDVDVNIPEDTVAACDNKSDCTEDVKEERIADDNVCEEDGDISKGDALIPEIESTQDTHDTKSSDDTSKDLACDANVLADDKPSDDKKPDEGDTSICDIENFNIDEKQESSDKDASDEIKSVNPLEKDACDVEKEVLKEETAQEDNLEIGEHISEENQDCEMTEHNDPHDTNEEIAEENRMCEVNEITEEQNNTEKSSGDIPHASDPFDDLLENDKSETISDSLEHQDSSGNMDNDLDNHILDDDMTPAIDDGESGNVADINHGQGADEEVCLLPDTEREITEADKLKALAGKKTIDIESTANAFDSLTKGTDDILDMKDEAMTDLNDESHVEDADGGVDDHIGEHDDAEDESLREIPDAEKENEEEHIAEETIDSGIIQEIVKLEQTCHKCCEIKDCSYRMLVDSDIKYLCTKNCVNLFQEDNPDKYIISHRKVTISEINPVYATCMQCAVEQKCYYRVTDADIIKNICKEKCLQLVVKENIEKYKLRKKKKWIVEIDEADNLCFVCSETKLCIFETVIEGETRFICNNDCLDNLQRSQSSVYKVKYKKKVNKRQAPVLKLKVISNAADKYIEEGNKVIEKTAAQAEAARIEREKSFLRKCAHCDEPYIGNDNNLSWETMDFCNEICLGKYQNIHGLHCANCKNAVSMVSLGKYCVRFGYDIRQFCCSGCLDEFKKGLKICCYCQRDISADYEGFLAPVGDQGQFKDFCSQFCVEKFDQMSKNPVPPPVWTQCAVCLKEKPTQLEVDINTKKPLRLCSEPCFAAFKFVNNVFPDQCRWCKKYFERISEESYTIYSDATAHCFCSKTCMNVYISNSRHIVPCNWCKVKKYNFDMIKKTLENGQSMMMCSLNCLTLYQVSVNAVSSRRIKCDQCKRFSQAQYHLTMSDATVRNFCTYQCVMSFQRQYSKSPMVADGDSQAVPTGAPRRTYSDSNSSGNQKVMKPVMKKSPGRPPSDPTRLPVISNVKSLANPAPSIGPVSGHATRAKSKKFLKDKPQSPPPVEPPKALTPPPPPPPKIYNHVIFKPPPPKEVKNVGTLTKPLMVTKGVSCRPHPCTKEVQTDDNLQRRILIPIPVPIYVPSPMAMYSLPLPIPIPIPVPIPVPVFIPTTRNSANGIMKEIKKIHDKMPTDPFEAELLMMAEMVAGDKKKAESDSESEEENGDDGFSPDPMDTGNSAFGEDVLQMALKMATEYEEPAVDLESAMTASTITPSSHPSLPAGMDENNPLHHHQLMLLEQQRAAAVAAAAANAASRKRNAQGGPSPVNTAGARSKRSRRNAEPPPPTHHVPPEPPREPQEKPDANMCLKYTFGVNAWKQWVMTKNAEMEKSTVRRKPFKSEILQLTADELNYSLCLFVKEVRKPNGSEYAPDTIYYLVLGIQQYLFENGRIDNIFTDAYYEKFTECLDEVARKFSVLYNDSQYIVTRVEEEHLWESKQLGAHSPHVLLSTLMFFNTKHFNLVTVEEHMQLSFSHIMKHWKRNPNQPGAAKIPGARNVLLRFYPPQSALEANSRKKKVYEQQENEENPLRCPVKLYEFYISKCPESVKTRNDVFYLMPERSCVPDSPVWYSTQALGREPLSKMLHRVKMVKEINIALLTS